MSKDIYNRFEEIQEGDKFVCTQSELQDFILCGLVLNVGKNKYILRDRTEIDIAVIGDPNYDFDIDFSSLLDIDLKEYNTNKVYYMTDLTYNKLKDMGYIVTLKDNEYYRFFSDELWLVKIL